MTVGVGGIGFVADDLTAAMLLFNEPGEAKPSDVIGAQLGTFLPIDIAGDPIDLPLSIDGVVGRARRFGPTAGLYCAITNQVAGEGLCSRSLTVESIVKIPTGVNGTFAIASCRSTSGGPTRAWIQRVVVSGSPAGTTVKLELAWTTSAGTAAVGSVDLPNAGAWMYLASVRRYVSETEIVVDHYLDGVLLGTGTVTAGGGIATNQNDHVTIGYDGATVAPAAFDIDDLRVSSNERTAEEIRQTYRRMFVYPEQGGQLVRAYLPPGTTYSTNPDSVIQREISVEGDAVAQFLAAAAELEEDFLPDRCNLARLARWERVLGARPEPGDTIGQRRERLLVFLKIAHGYSRKRIRGYLADALGQDEADVDIRENSNRQTYDFTPGLEAAWVGSPGVGTIDDSSGTIVELIIGAGDDGRWLGDFVSGPTPRIMLPLAEQDGCEVLVFIGGIGQADEGDRCGVIFRSLITDDTIFFGIRYTSGQPEWFSERRVGGVATLHTYGPYLSNTWVRIRHRGREADVTDRWDFYYSYTGFPEGPFAAAALQIEGPGPDRASHVGLMVASGDASPSLSVFAQFYEFRLWCPLSQAPFAWQVFRDPGLPGEYDLDRAQQIIDRVKPAHTYGSVTESMELVCDDDESLVGMAPLGS
ncbi:MAG: putative phage tail protein [Baekduiaceae bacterium]